jgi:hypothetical protein
MAVFMKDKLDVNLLEQAQDEITEFLMCNGYDEDEDTTKVLTYLVEGAQSAWNYMFRRLRVEMYGQMYEVDYFCEMEQYKHISRELDSLYQKIQRLRG